MPSRPFRIKKFSVTLGLVVGFAFFTLAKAHSARRAEPSPATAAGTVESLPSPAGTDSSEPQFTAQGDHVILSWLEVSGPHATLKFAERTPSGWSAAKNAASGDNFFVNSADVPSVRMLADGTLAAHWLQRNTGDADSDSDAYNVRLSWSKDQGQTWSRPVAPHHDGTKTEHGFVSTFQAPGAGLGLVWLDGRATDPEKDTGNMALRASIYSPDGKQVHEMVIAPRVCECCSTSTALTSEGVIVAFRNRSQNEIRDIYVSRLTGDTWSAPVAVHNDGWQINACPINGPAISARGRDVAVAWFTAKDDKGRTFIAFSHDTGRTFGPPTRVDDAGSQGRVGVQLLENGSAEVTWVELANQNSAFEVRTIAPDGTRSPAITVAQTAGSGFPRLALDRGDLLFSWTETANDSLHVRTARLTANLK